MTDSTNQYRLLRTGGVRAASTHAGRGGRTGRYVTASEILAPNLDEFGHRPFDTEALNALAVRLQDPRWPRGTLNIYGLEGLLTALLVLPLGMRPGVWLPLVWNEAGWKAPLIIQGAEQFADVMETFIGYLRMLDRGFAETPPQFVSALDRLEPRYRPKSLHPLQDWARGFGLALNHSGFLRTPPVPVARQALYTIAAHVAPPTALELHSATGPKSLQQAVLALARVRTSRGPLGKFISHSKTVRRTENA